MEIEPVAHIYTPFPEKFGIPRQSGLAPSAEGRIVFTPKYRQPDSVRGLEEYSHLWIIWDFSENHKSGWRATAAPPKLGGRKRVGVFACRSPFRPNPLGLSCVTIKEVVPDTEEGPVIIVGGVDMLDGTPVFDIKPYLPYSDAHPEAKGGFSSDGEHRLQVVFAEEIAAEIGEEKLTSVEDVLKADPRTAYIHDPERLWGVSYDGMNIRFTVDGEVLTVREVWDEKK
ncbi:MAG: tRNA (N6-threonylcarbamoyladenosine(37)-N6)-methyltransferase TrmO [Lachnospiraceae bacterium]|nr:tRNA (N6-threonylcarbamoyladenosine(37)-N6)-methyltransferase TrmO [Lachnospiraceae bacterium]